MHLRSIFRPIRGLARATGPTAPDVRQVFKIDQQLPVRRDPVFSHRADNYMGGTGVFFVGPARLKIE